jgi:deazaflavin-dependent oxidoreductase (nitroreductase family)
MTTENAMNDWNAQVMSDLRANGGKGTGPFEGVPLLILHHTGAKSGRERETPLCYLPDGDRWVIFASKAGAPTHPHWYLNVHANPDVSVEVDGERIPARATEVTGDERDALYARQVEAMPQFGEYQEKTDRLIPVVVLTPA